MSKKKTNGEADDSMSTSSSIDEMLLAALDRGGNTLETGRYIATLKEGGSEKSIQSLSNVHGLRVADARDFNDQAVDFQNVGDSDAVLFPEIGVALIGAGAAQERGLNAQAEISSESAYDSIDPEYFVFPSTVQDYVYSLGQTAETNSGEYLRGFLRAAEIISKDLQLANFSKPSIDVEPEVLGATWGLNACKVPSSSRSGLGIKVAVLDTGMDLGHPDFVGRAFVTQTFVGQPVQDLFGHGTHCTGTACGKLAPAGNIPRYGIGHRTTIYVGKVLSNTGSGSSASVLAGMNWAVANRCTAISMSLGSPTGVYAPYTAAGQAALNNGCLIIAAAGNDAGPTGAPANSPTIMAVASLDPNLAPSSFSNFGKIQISGPGRDVFSSWPRPTLYKTISGTSMATPHVSGCAALWAETSAVLRGQALWNKLVATAKHLPYPVTRVGAGLVQAP